MQIIHDSTTAPIIRAAAIKYLGQQSVSGTAQALIRQELKNTNPMVRKEALVAFVPVSQNDLITTLSPLLKDTTLLVRMTATRRLLHKGIGEYIKAMDYSADFAPSRHNLGVLYMNLGQLKKAEAQFREALRIDNRFYPAKVNLALVYNKMGENKKAEVLLKEVTRNHPELAESFYSLGLLEAEMKNYPASAHYLQLASQKLPDRPRVFLNLAKVLQYLQHLPEAEKAYQKAYLLAPAEPNYLSALIAFYLKTGQKAKAVHYLKLWLKAHPDDSGAKKLLQKLNGQI